MHIDDLIHRKEGENVVFYLRRDIIVLLGNLLLIAFFAMIPLGIRWFVMWQSPGLFDGPVIEPLLTLLVSAYYLMVWLFFFATYVDYYLDAWIVTSDRVINVEQRGLFNRTISELDLANVQDVTSEVKGVIAFFFRYGNVYVQTAAEKEYFIFEQVPRPDEIRKRLLLLVEEDRQRQGGVSVAPGTQEE